MVVRWSSIRSWILEQHRISYAVQFNHLLELLLRIIFALLLESILIFMHMLLAWRCNDRLVRLLRHFFDLLTVHRDVVRSETLHWRLASDWGTQILSYNVTRAELLRKVEQIIGRNLAVIRRYRTCSFARRLLFHGYYFRTWAFRASPFKLVGLRLTSAFPLFILFKVSCLCRWESWGNLIGGWFIAKRLLYGDTLLFGRHSNPVWNRCVFKHLHIIALPTRIHSLTLHASL